MFRHFYLQDGEEVTCWVSLENEFITAMGSLISGEPCSHYLQAITNCRIWTHKKADWTALYQTHAAISAFWLGALEKHIMSYEDRVYQQLAGDKFTKSAGADKAIILSRSFFHYGM